MRTPLFILLFFCSISVRAQEMWGISNSNFAGNMGIFINPSSIVGAPYRNEINFLAGDFYVENSYVYFPASTRIIPRALFGTVPSGKLYKYDNSLSRQKGFAHALIIGPSYIVNRENYAWGIHTALRSELSILQAPNELSYVFYNKFVTPELYGVRSSTGKFNSAQATWIEIGGTYGSVLKDNPDKYLKWAGTLNGLIGMNGYYLDVNNMDYTILDSTNYIFHSVDGTFAHAFNPSNKNNVLALRGFGASTTVGLTFIRKRNTGAFDCTYQNDRQIKYKYRLGISLLDLGFIRMSKDAKITTVQTSTDRLWSGIDTTVASSFVGIDSLLLTNIGGNTRNESFSIWTPTALSIQFDYQIKPNIFANASVVQRLHFRNNQIARPNQINLSGRYERRAYEFNLNFSMWELRQPSLGIAARFHWFVIGTDRILQLFSLSDVRSFDFFFGFKYQFCSSPFGSRKKDCPAYD